MSRRVPSSGTSRAGSRAPSLASSSRLSRAPSSNSIAPPDSRRVRASAAAATPSSSLRVNADIPETNINVVVRCRGRTRQEIEENSPPITTTEGPLSKAITIETTPAAASSTLSTFTTASAYGGSNPNTKTYPFDKVFGPEADQTMVFNEVAERMLDEVLHGYNCTIFAYGQTGTGKTFTMQGDVTPTPLMAPSTDAGIIPRVLHRLFALLEAQENAEYAVKCSYIEIYNEELRDLLAYDYGSSSAGSNIKIFEDAAKKGVTIQGVEEAGIRDLKDGLAILRKGSQRRQVAETKLNTESSRSHSIFTLTVHVKETSMEKGGEDLLRIGKFNLVDLAGSEAIGRSGAENKRAREAGMINQSLLTLGRVISSLVDKSHHIPYRESKLTRLLQDSLGGRTKTCIIATVSPTKSNVEETLSTLDYALRAKSIRNKPELNAHLTKAGLLREYIGDMERLKAELHAAREKNGVYIPEDQWKEMSEEKSQRKLDYDEAKQRVTAVEVELKTRRTEFEQLTARFVTTTDELAQTREAERQLTVDLEAAKVNVEAMRAALDDERAVAQAYLAGEERLNGVAGELRSVAVDSVRDVGGLFDKLGRVTHVLDNNTGSATAFGSEMKALSSDLQHGISQLRTVQEQFGSTLRSDLEAYAKRGEHEASRHLADLDKSFDALNNLVAELSDSVEKGKLQATEASAAVLAAKDEVQASVRAWAKQVNTRSTRMVDDVVQHQQQHLATVGAVLESTTSLVDNVILATREHMQFQAQAIERAGDLASRAAEAEITRLRAQNTLLAELVAEERAKTARLRTDLVSNITAMVEQFTESQDASLIAAITQVQTANEGGMRDMVAFGAAHGEAIEDVSAADAGFRTSLDGFAGQTAAQRERGPEALAEVSAGMRSRLEEYAGATAAHVGEHVDAVAGLCGTIGAHASQLSANAGVHAAGQHAAIGTLAETARVGHGLSTERVRAGADEVARLTSTLLASHASSSKEAGRAHASAKRKLDAIQDSTARFVAGLATDEPTGDTPRKRPYEFPRAWERTAPRDVLLQRLRQGVAAGQGLGGSVSSAVSGTTAVSASPDVSSVVDEGEGTPVASIPDVSDDVVAAPAAPMAPIAVNVGTRRMKPPKKLAEYDGSHRGHDRPSLTVLGDGGNIPPVRKRRV